MSCSRVLGWNSVSNGAFAVKHSGKLSWRMNVEKQYRSLLNSKLLDEAVAANVVWARVKGYPYWPVSLFSVFYLGVTRALHLVNFRQTWSAWEFTDQYSSHPWVVCTSFSPVNFQYLHELHGWLSAASGFSHQGSRLHPNIWHIKTHIAGYKPFPCVCC